MLYPRKLPLVTDREWRNREMVSCQNPAWRQVSAAHARQLATAAAAIAVLSLGRLLLRFPPAICGTFAKTPLGSCLETRQPDLFLMYQQASLRLRGIPDVIETNS